MAPRFRSKCCAEAHACLGAKAKIHVIALRFRTASLLATSMVPAEANLVFSMVQLNFLCLNLAVEISYEYL